MVAQASEAMEKYFASLDYELDRSLSVSKEARKQGKDPEDRVDIPIARSMAERVVGLISTVAPQITDSGMTKRISELEKKYTPQSWEIALIIAEEVAKEKFCKFKDKKEAIEVGIRVGMAYSTAGIVAAPLEGFVEVNIKKRNDGKEYLAASYAGPIRGAGGTAAAVSVLICDYVRMKMGYMAFDPTEIEVKRFCREIADYHERVTNLQYFPSEEELSFLTQHLPIEVTGDPTEIIEVSNYKDLPRMQTNKIRGGMCLVIAEGLAQKAPKLWKRLSVWGEKMGLEWGFLEEFLAVQKRVKAKQETSVKAKEKITPNYTFIADLVAGRPVLSYPMREGGFRLRYGRTRCSGYSAASINPATMCLLDNFIAVGTQLKIERPGKAASITPCDIIDGPIIKLKNGSVLKVNKEEDARLYRSQVEEILFLGDMLINYGDFSENNHLLVPSGYCPEWWALEVEKATVENFGSLDMEKLSELVTIDPEILEELVRNPMSAKISSYDAIEISRSLGVPLHPNMIFFWSLLKKDDILMILDEINKAKIVEEEGKVKKIVFRFSAALKSSLEKAGVPHVLVNEEFIVISSNDARAMLFTFNMQDRSNYKDNQSLIYASEKKVIDILSDLCGSKIRDKAGTFIGARMGRPEKAKMRKLTGSPHTLFPVGEEGGRLRSFQSAVEKSSVKSLFPVMFCDKCSSETIYRICELCSSRTRQRYVFTIQEEGRTKNVLRDKFIEGAKTYRQKEVEVGKYFDLAIKDLGLKAYPDIIKGVRGTSNKDHIPENLVKGILRAKHNIYVNKDGTTRYDMTELPITHFKPSEIFASVEKLRVLGYTKDINGRELIDDEQILEIKPQDVILPCNENSVEDSADKVLFRVAAFLDDLLVNFYKLEPFYNLKEPSDLIGHIVVGLAPHTSAGSVGRIIGFSKTQGMFCHPLFHAAMRRDCDGDEACVMLILDAFLNFSRQFLPDRRGSRTMDSPLVLTSRLIPSEVDDMAHGLDIMWKYPLDFYEAALEYKNPREIKMVQLASKLNTPEQYEGMGFTHPTSSINKGVLLSAYKTLPTMQEKLLGQMQLAEKIRAVNVSDVAEAVIQKHFLKDIRGNLRKFSMQQFRCVSCNEKFRRPPLSGSCTKCSGKIIFTIAEGSVAKYLEPSISLATKYKVSPYMQQTLEITKKNFEAVFGRDKEKQTGLGDWFA